jgi:hypothetical protein
MFGTQLADEPYGDISIHKNEFYIPKAYGVKELDRYEPISGERYIVTTVQPYRYPSLDYVTLESDTRQ